MIELLGKFKDRKKDATYLGVIKGKIGFQTPLYTSYISAPLPLF